MRTLNDLNDQETDMLLLEVLKNDARKARERGIGHADVYQQKLVRRDPYVTMHTEPLSHHSNEWNALMEIGERRHRDSFH